MVAPGIPDTAQYRLMEKYCPTYGKTFHMWQVDKDPLPFGPPQLMMSLTSDGQVDRRLLEKRDKRLGVNTEEERKKRENIPWPAVDHAADQGTQG